ncbi:hypothetical protein NIES4071_103080 (plasmid) [Calothrix sp. NIES-4071]|nr:hypothetical protein NIES4071_103080 [Calothrix sp. NIES-4071]BAZ64689.1 hypothetical protein NIES4105_104220 [Calothrix sp. NIES-4105]
MLCGLLTNCGFKNPLVPGDKITAYLAPTFRTDNLLDREVREHDIKFIVVQLASYIITTENEILIIKMKFIESVSSEIEIDRFLFSCQCDVLEVVIVPVELNIQSTNNLLKGDTKFKLEIKALFKYYDFKEKENIIAYIDVIEIE